MQGTKQSIHSIGMCFINIHMHLTYVTGHEKIGLMYTQNLTTFLNFELQ